MDIRFAFFEELVLGDSINSFKIVFYRCLAHNKSHEEKVYFLRSHIWTYFN